MPSPLPARVTVSGLTKRYGATTALDRVGFEAREGAIYGLVGPNGAGKTTLLESVLGLRRPDAGSITIGGIDALAEPERSRERVGALLQSTALQDKITPRQALRLFGSFYAEPVPVAELLERFALGEKADAAFETLSGGQKQRLFLALAFVNRPGVLVLDEPSAGLDPNARRDLHRDIAVLRDGGRTVLVSTHDLAEAQQLCDRVGILDHGTVVAEGSPAELIAAARATPRLVFRAAADLAAPRLAALPGVSEVQRQGERWVLGSRDPNGTLVALVPLLGAAPLAELEIRQPTLEDVFFERTGRSWKKEDAS